MNIRSASTVPTPTTTCVRVATSDLHFVQAKPSSTQLLHCSRLVHGTLLGEIVNGGFITPAWRYCHGRLRLAKRLACGRGNRSGCWLEPKP